MTVHCVPYAPGLSAYLDGCRCVPCREAAAPMHWAADEYIRGDLTLREMGAELGVSHERARQMLDMWFGGFEQRNGRRQPRSGAAAKARRAEKARQRAVEARRVDRELRDRATAEGVTCRVCGTSHHRVHQGGWSLTCSPDCAAMWTKVRLFDPEYHREHMKRVARWGIAHADQLPDTQVAYCRRVLAGEVTHDSGGWVARDRVRWLTEGSARWEIACRAYREGWPTFVTWPEDIQQQIREHFEAEAEAA